MRSPLPLAPIALTCLALTFSGCSTFKPKADPTQFFVLRSLAEAPDPAEAATGTVERLQVGPGRFPDYLGATEMAVEDGRNGIRYLDLYHWAEPLKDGVGRVMAENLGRLLHASNVAVYPDTLPNRSGLRVTYRVLKFEGGFDHPVVLEVRWDVTEIATDEVVASDQTRYLVPTEGRSSNAADYARRMSEAIHEWSLDVTMAINR